MRKRPWDNYRSTSVTTVITFFACTAILGILVAWGWVLNIIDLLRMSDILVGEGAVRIAGIFIPPLGALLGWFM